jgi:hypothetical protein
LAQIFQHEVDHLNGVLFTDTAKDLQDIPPERMHSHKKAESKTGHKTAVKVENKTENKTAPKIEHVAEHKHTHE